jgi:glycosyltransferase involved in cell wall biosynthesis
MAHGLPCVVTSVGALPEMVEDGRTGHLVAPNDGRALADQLLRCIEEPEYAAPGYRRTSAGREALRHGTESSRRIAHVLDAFPAKSARARREIEHGLPAERGPKATHGSADDGAST